MIIKSGFIELYNTTWGQRYYFSLGQKNEEFRKDIQRVGGINDRDFFDRFGEEFDMKKFDGITNPIPEGHIIVRVREEVDTPYGMDILMHEVFHAVCKTLSRRGLTHCDESEEAYAYLQGWMVGKLFEAFVEIAKDQKASRKKKKPEPAAAEN